MHRSGIPGLLARSQGALWCTPKPCFIEGFVAVAVRHATTFSCRVNPSHPNSPWIQWPVNAMVLKRWAQLGTILKGDSSSRFPHVVDQACHWSCVTAGLFPLPNSAYLTSYPQVWIPGELLVNILLVSVCVPGNLAGNRDTPCLKPLSAQPYLLPVTVALYSVAPWIHQNFPAETASFFPFENIHPIIIIYGLLLHQEVLRRVSSNGALPQKLSHRSRQKLSGVCSQI